MSSISSWLNLTVHSLLATKNLCLLSTQQGFPFGSAGKESAGNAGDPGSIPGLGRSPGEGKGYTLQYSGLESHRQTRLSDFHFHFFKYPTINIIHFATSNG